MKEYFDIKEQIDKTTALRYFSEHEEERNISDDYAKEIIRLLEADDSLSYWKCNSTIRTTQKLRLPSHIHDVELVEENGVLLNDFYRHFEEHKKNPAKKACIDKISKLKEVFFAESSDTYHANFILLSNDGEKVHKGNYFGTFKNELFIANGFHRLAAYRLALQELEPFIPMEIYYAHNPDIVNKYFEMK